VFHGLRPLLVVLDSACEPLLRYWQRLSAQSACRIVCPQQLHPRQAPAAAEPDANGDFSEQRSRIVARQIVLEGAHFGLWVSGDGETCQVIDERGEPVAAASLLLLLAQFLGRNGEEISMAVSAKQAIELESKLASPGLRLCIAGNARQQLAEQMEHSAAQLGSDGRGRYWYPGGGTPDALATLCLLLTLLSESDRHLSEVLDAGVAAK
jgi:phosphomannomutase